MAAFAEELMAARRGAELLHGDGSDSILLTHAHTNYPTIHVRPLF